ncbi:Non-histone chromosomal protein 6 [Tieghemiomyces parasiticus]|uniref:Non-histone chromosomal protein 6 n=1 Tax=Tieghemiomyces parasiticus TaxID=78921 RepID=A0A9W8A5A6_9FUNG|nr:Non-histone chromosomal protein 6 [Tieghemiomyces parasiticus]
MAKIKQDSSGKKRRAKKDPNAPKRYMSAYMWFAQDVRDRVKQESPTLTFGEIGKKLGQLWRELPEHERGPYQRKSDEDKARYEREKAAYEHV